MGIKANGLIYMLDCLFLLAIEVQGISQTIMGMGKAWAKFNRQFQFGYGSVYIAQQG